MKSEKEVLTEIGLRLKMLRKQKGFTSYEHFAIEHDLSRMHYWKIEKGKANITIRTLVHLLKLHNCSIEDFFGLDIKDEK
jgi:transcriptional regulator with XRE-family HTH domain